KKRMVKEDPIIMKNQIMTPMKTKVLSVSLSILVSFVSFLSFAEVSYAEPPRVLADETVYVNMDYYGKITDVSIVKGCDLNGNKTFTDYGNYQSVTNMSGYDKPILTSTGVTWNLKDIKDRQRFYYSCDLKNNAIEFPWFIDVSYKLDGVPCRAEKLAGASGLIEIDIKVTPNDNAKVYYKNNMLLQVGTYINMEDNYSLDAPGSQLQSVGSKKAVMFAALPGEADTFTIRIGTDSFEIDGITVMMVPGTLDQLKNIKDLKEARDTVDEAGDAIYISMNEMLKTMESMNDGLNELKSGAIGMEDARSTFSSGKDQLYGDFDTAMEDLSALNKQLENLIPYFETGQRMIRSINNDIDDMIDTLEELEDPLEDTESTITVMQRDLTSLKSMMAALNSQMGTMLTNLSAVAASGSATAYEMTELQGQAEMATTLNSYMDEINSLLSETVEMGDTTKEIIEITKDLIDETEDFSHTLNRYEDDMTDLLGEMEKLTSLTNTSLNSTIVLMSYTKSLMQQTGDKLDPAMKQSLKGMIDLLDKSISNMDDIAAMRRANTTMKVTIDKQFDKIEDENKFINLDAEASLQSFTSDQNPTPLSSQVLLRTKEISLDDSDETGDLEKAKEDIGIFNRIKKIFIELWNGIRHLL
ncbi:MAG: hypothetical protein AAGU75_11170, partial [Bacillota bacterium]